jgi:alpha-beta hydrolase superfamily lysophospholipase
MNIYKIIKKPFFGKYMVKWINPLNENERKDWKEIQTESQSGAKIIGLFANSITVKQKATIVLAHPMGKEAKAYFIKNGYTDLLRENGYNVLIFDINGFGESSNGNFSYFEDIIAISHKAKELTPNLLIGYHGISLGAMWSSIAFAQENHFYNFAIIESSATTLEDFWINFPIAHKTLKFLYLLLPKYKNKIRMIDRIKEVKNLKSILFIYSYIDNWTTVEMGKKLYENCNVKSELWIVENAKHAMIMKSEHKDEYKNKIIQYFDKSIIQHNQIK